VSTPSVLTPEACIGTALPDWYHVTELAASIGTPTGLPLGVKVELRGDTVWLSGTPLDNPGVYNYEIPVNGKCGGTALATGTVELRDISLLPVVTGGPYVYCVDEVPSGSLEATGLNLLWYEEVVGGVGSATAPVAVTTTEGEIIYYVTQREAGKCESNRLPVPVTVVAPPTANAGSDRRIEEGQSVVLNGTALPSTPGGSITVSWTPSATLTNATTARPTAKPAETTVYTMTVTTSEGCEAKDEVEVVVFELVDIPNVFSPNGDGVHDKWFIAKIEQYVNSVVEIYNRYGSKVYEQRGYNSSNAWDGTNKGVPYPVGPYYYLISLGNGKPVFKGTVSIVR
jgi:gliding motility-associated-like protein